ncbi:MAG: hypothetical protein DWQ20_00830 [Actinobacteria bacterium]|nr:MAG: hypothetical protein DWQ20_00830 [Actinomycetota bacterium]
MRRRCQTAIGAAAFAIALVAYGFLVGSQVGCSTIAGVGRDLQDAAEWTAERLDHGFNRPKK